MSPFLTRSVSGVFNSRPWRPQPDIEDVIHEIDEGSDKSSEFGMEESSGEDGLSSVISTGLAYESEWSEAEHLLHLDEEDFPQLTSFLAQQRAQ